MSAAFLRLGRFAARRRAAVVAAYAAVSLVLAWLGAGIHLETSLTELLPRGTASADDYRDLVASGGVLDRLLISIAREPPDEDPGEEAAALAEAAASLADALRATGLVGDVRYGVGEDEAIALARAGIRHLPVLLDPDAVPAAAARLSPEAVRASVAALRRRATMPGFSGIVEEMAAIDPLGLLPLLRLPGGGPGGARPDPESGLLLSRDGRRLLVVAEAARPPTEVSFSRRLMEAVGEAEEAIRREGPAGARLRFDHAGGHLVALEDERRVRRDAAATSLVALAGVALVYVFVIRRPALWLAILVPVVMSTVWTLGLASLHPGRLNLVTVAFAAILLGIGDDAMIHMYLREREERARGVSAPDSAAAALGATGPAVTVATLTTAAAFLALSFVRFRGLAELGVVAAMGMLALLAGVLLFFPAALAVLAERARPGAGPAVRLPARAILRIHDACARRRTAVLAAAGLLTALMLAAASGMRVATDLRSIRGEDPAAEALRRVLAPFGSDAAAETLVVLHGGRDAPPAGAAVDRGLEAAFALEPVCEALRREEVIAGCDSPSRAAPPERIQRGRFEAASALPWTQALEALAAEARVSGIDEAFFAPFAGAARAYADFDAVRIRPDPSRLGPAGVPATVVRFRDPARAAEIASALGDALPGREARIASIALVSADLGRVIAEDFRLAAWLVAGAIALTALAAFRSLKLFALTVAPVVVGCVWMLGILRLAGAELSLMTLMGMPIVFGLGVDYGVYVVDRWSRERETPRQALAGVGPAVLVTGLTTLAGFGALLFARLAGLRSLGLAVVLGAACTLAAALILLPLLLPERR